MFFGSLRDEGIQLHNLYLYNTVDVQYIHATMLDIHGPAHSKHLEMYLMTICAGLEETRFASISLLGWGA